MAGVARIGLTVLAGGKVGPLVVVGGKVGLEGVITGGGMRVGVGVAVIGAACALPAGLAALNEYPFRICP